jgi:Lon protease-like protein
MICPLGFQDKQALLEAANTGARADTLSTLLEMENSGQILNIQDNDDVRH